MQPGCGGLLTFDNRLSSYPQPEAAVQTSIRGSPRYLHRRSRPIRSIHRLGKNRNITDLLTTGSVLQTCQYGKLTVMGSALLQMAQIMDSGSPNARPEPRR